MPWIIKLKNGFVKNGKQDTEKVEEAKKFKTQKQAKAFVQSSVSGVPYKIIELPEVYDESK